MPKIKIEDLAKQASEQNQQREQKQGRHKELTNIVSSSDAVQNAIVQTTRVLLDYLDDNDLTAEVKNFPEFPKEISTPDVTHVVAALESLHDVVREKNVDLGPVIEAMYSLGDLIDTLPKAFPEIPEPLKSIEVNNISDVTKVLQELKSELKNKKLETKVDVKPTDVKIDLKSIEDKLDDVCKSLENQKFDFPEYPEIDQTPVIEGLQAVQDTINGLSFPVPNMKPTFKDAEGNSAYPVITSDGKVPVSSSNLIDTNNSTTTPLAGDAVFTGTATDVSQYAAITVFVYSDQDSATDGFQIQFSSDGTNWDETLSYTYTNGSAKDLNVPVNAQYFRLKFTNGSTPQTEFRAQVILHTSPIPSEPSRLKDNVSPEKDATITKSAIIAQSSGQESDFVPVAATNGGSLKIALEEAPATVTTTSETYAIRIDDSTTANTTYIGKASIGSATSGTVWQIQRIDESSGTVVEWADGDADFNNVWDNRASLSYS